jgi:ATP-binding cassette subfamily B protein/ATP-binding cassette subfamily C protein
VAQKKLSTRQYISSLAKVARASFKLSPLMAILQLVDSMITALLPIATTALAAATTTALTEAYAGDEQAQHTVLPLVIATALVGALTLVWNSVNRYLTEKNRICNASKNRRHDDRKTRLITVLSV